MVRAMPVTPAAAERSSGSTTAIVYDCRVGTSICEMENRTSSTAIASDSVGMSGTSTRSTFEGRCVATIVFTSPMRRAIHAADSAETPASRFAPKKIAPSVAGPTPKRAWNHHATKLWTTKPPAKASTEKSAESRRTVPRDRCSPRSAGRGEAALTAGASIAGERRVNTATSATPATP